MITFKPKPDPVIESHAPCFVCGGERPILARLSGDPFCKTECCKKFHEVKNTGTSGT